MKGKAWLFILLFIAVTARAQDLVTDQKAPNAFPIVTATGVTAIYAGSGDHWLVQKAASFLQQDIEAVTGRRPMILDSLPAQAQNLIIIGSLDRSPLIRRLAAGQRIPGPSLKGKWEAYSLSVIAKPAPGIGRAFVIAGSDRRGTAYGVFEISREMGVSPWYWWADVPVKKKEAVYIRDGSQHAGPPAVKYRGFFINDEAPAFSGWTREKYGGVNHHVYEKIFELLLRLKANYLWPAMWNNAFNDDDTLDPVLADKYGIVMGTSHHEPMMRAQQEWKRYGHGPWNYATNGDTLRAFWKKGIEHMDSHESIVTIGMRGDGDKPMTQGSNVELLEKIVKDQRQIIADVTHKDPSATPQDWALYKEVQDYYDKGMRVPDDVTLLLCDDNWGNIRRLPKWGDKPRAGGYGVYYHFDYVGGPRNYKWLNTNPIARVWEQMHLGIQYGVDRIWIVNVGDIKPMEFPISFFMDYAWNPKRWPASSLDEYTRRWAAAQFGPMYAKAIGSMLTRYTRYNGRRKPELLSPETYSLLDYREATTVAADYNRLAKEADSLYQILPEAYRDAFYELLLYPVKACANLNDLYVTVGLNRLYASQGRALTNPLADRARWLFGEDTILSHTYNKVIADGKWDHMMDQTHIGYVYWQEPRMNRMPEVKTINEATGDSAAWGLSVEGSASWWPKAAATEPAVLPVFDPYGEPGHYMELFSRTGMPVDGQYEVNVPWLRISPDTDKEMGKDSPLQHRLWISVDWAKAPAGRTTVPIIVSAPGGAPVAVTAIVDKPSLQPPSTAGGQPRVFVEGDGYVSMEAAHYARAIGQGSIHWLEIPDLGRTLSGMEAVPVTAAASMPGGADAHLEYPVFLFDTGAVHVQAYFSPTLDFTGTGILRYAVSLDNEAPQTFNIAEGGNGRAWDKWVSDNIIIKTSEHHISKPGLHVLKFWRVDPGVVLQKIVVDAGGEKPSYLGPPESMRR